MSKVFFDQAVNIEFAAHRPNAMSKWIFPDASRLRPPTGGASVSSSSSSRRRHRRLVIVISSSVDFFKLDISLKKNKIKMAKKKRKRKFAIFLCFKQRKKKGFCRSVNVLLWSDCCFR
jgi:hypothetical protein